MTPESSTSHGDDIDRYDILVAGVMVFTALAITVIGVLLIRGVL